MNYQVIYLNGPSSSGKTTLATALQNSFSDPFLYISIDKIIDLMPPSINDFTGQKKTLGYYFKHQKIVVGPYAKKMTPLFHQIVLTILKNGHNLIIDDIAFGAKQVDVWRQILKDYKVLWIGITASQKVLESREKSRGDRLVGSALDQLKRVHRGVSYDLIIDTSIISIKKCVKQIFSIC